MRGKVCVFGSFNVDIMARTSRFPLPGESLVANSSMTSAGGKGANQALAALKSGANVHYIGKIGKDSFGHFARRHLKSVGYDALTILESEELPTGNALVFVSEGKSKVENMICVDPGANMTVTDKEIARCAPSISCAKVILVQLENNLSAIKQVINIGRHNNAFIILNPTPKKVVADSLLQSVDLVTANLNQTEFMTGIKVENEQSAILAANKLHQRGCKIVVITMGLWGTFLSNLGEQKLIPASPSKPIDSTGASDAFNGALAAKIGNNETLEDAIHFASAYAAVSTEELGAAPDINIVKVVERLQTSS